MIGKIKARLQRKQLWQDKLFIPLLLVGAGVAMVIALAIGLNQSVWFDEAYSILLAQQNTEQLLYLTSLDAHPPLYYLLLKAWAFLFGFGELALRSLSILAMGGALVIAGLLLRRMFSVRIALMALPFLVFAPMLLRYGFEIRAYAIASLIGIVATYVLVAALQAKRRNQWLLYTLYAILVAAGMLTLYYMALLWIAHLVWLLWTHRDKRTLWKAPWIAALAGSVALFLPWMPVFVSQLSNGALAPVTQALTLENLMGIVSFMFAYQPVWLVGPFISLVIIAVIVIMTKLTVRVLSTVDKKHRPYLLLLGCYVLVPIVILALVSLVRPMYLERYLSHVMIGGYMLVGVIIAMTVLKSTGRKAIIVSAGILAVLGVGVMHVAEAGNYNYQRLQKPMVKQAAAELADCSADRTILAGDPYLAIELSYYLSNCEVRFYSETSELKGGYAPLAKSPLQVADPATELTNSRELVYLYYDEPSLVMPQNLMAAERTSYDKLYMETYYAEGAR